MSEKETKARITEQAFRLFLDQGYKNTSMNDLVKATSLSKGAFYHYFDNKEKIYLEVIDTYFIAYYQQINWKEVEKLSLKALDKMMENFYETFVPEILSKSKKGMSRYFMLFFEAFDMHPEFKNTVQQFYQQLHLVLTKALKNNGSPDPEQTAKEKIARFEGMIFWTAIFPDH